jgi:hypothetical protein
MVPLLELAARTEHIFEEKKRKNQNPSSMTPWLAATGMVP